MDATETEIIKRENQRERDVKSFKIKQIPFNDKARMRRINNGDKQQEGEERNTKKWTEG